MSPVYSGSASVVFSRSPCRSFSSSSYLAIYVVLHQQLFYHSTRCGWACLPDCCPLSLLSGDDDLWLGMSSWLLPFIFVEWWWWFVAGHVFLIVALYLCWVVMMICGWACLPDCCPLSLLSGDDDLWLGMSSWLLPLIFVEWWWWFVHLTQSAAGEASVCFPVCASIYIYHTCCWLVTLVVRLFLSLVT